MPSEKTHPIVTAAQVGDLLKSARKGRKLTQREVAAKVGLSQNRVSHLELHPEELSVKQLLALGAAVGLQLHVGERVAPSRAPSSVEW